MAATMFKCATCGVMALTRAGFLAHICSTSDLASNSQSEENGSHMIANSSPTAAAVSFQSLAQSTLWDTDRTKLLLSLYIERMDQFSSPLTKKKHIWEQITQEMNNKNCNFTQSQVEGRWKTVVAAYRKHKDEQRKTGAARKTFQYSEEVNEIFGDSHACSPKYLMSSTTCTQKDSTSKPPQEEESHDDDNEKTAEGGNNIKRKINHDEQVEKRRKGVTGASQMITFLKTYTESMEKKTAINEKKIEERHNANIKGLNDMVDVLKGLNKGD